MQMILEAKLSPSQPILPSPPLAVQTPLPPEIQHFLSAQGFFEIDFLAGWTVKELDTGTVFKSPTNTSFFQVSWIYTGYPLDTNSFIRLVDGRETNMFQGYQQYYEISRDVEVQTVAIQKRFSMNGEKKVVLTSYQQADRVVYIVDFWSDPAYSEENKKTFSTIISSLITKPEAVTSQASSTQADYFLYVTEYFTFRVPVHWKLTRTTGRFSVVDTFRSPDEMAVFQTMVYFDSEPILKKEVSQFVLSLLHRFYTKDITITGDHVLEDRQEVLTWYSRESNMHGTTTFQIRENTLILYTTMYTNNFEELYRPILEQIIGSYQFFAPTATP